MKKYLLTLVLALATLGAGAQTDTLRILAIGNSFSQDAVNENLGDLFAAAGQPVIIVNMYIGGCSLERHWKNMKEDKPAYAHERRVCDGKLVIRKEARLSEALTEEPWDVVTFQQQSSSAGFFESHEPFLGELITYVRSIVPAGCRLMWQQTWAYTANSANRAMTTKFGSQKKMFDALMTTSKQVCEKYGLDVIPTGAAVQNLKSSYDRDNCHRDGYHLSFTMGRYLSGCTWYEAISGKSVIGNGYHHPYLAADRCELAQKAAHFAVQNPFALTDMKALGYELPRFDKEAWTCPEYTLPDPLVMNDGSKVRSRKQWYGQRRPELLAMFENEMYGKAPGRPEDLSFKVLSEDKQALGGKATRKEIEIRYAKNKLAYFVLLVYTPNGVNKAPMFLGANFKGNWAVSSEEGISIPRIDNDKFGTFPFSTRGEAASRWPLEEILDAGYGVATFYRGDVSPDYDCSWNMGAQKFFATGRWNRMPAVGEHEWGTIATWAWGLSRAMDYLETDPGVDAGRVAVMGHSRLGKAALWAGAVDQRFAMVVSNDSGCGGAALSRRCYGETVEAINKHFPHWFCRSFRQYCGREDELPFDQHELLALIAPRPLCVGSATLDDNADPEGERIALEEAGKVYRFLGAKGKTNYHIREGKHDITIEDWKIYLDFADKHMK